MAVLGSGKAHGACSLLHAAGLGYGASMALDLPVAVRLLDAPSKRELDDPDGLLDGVLEAWVEGGNALPEGKTLEDLHWAVVKNTSAPGTKIKRSNINSCSSCTMRCDFDRFERC